MGPDARPPTTQRTDCGLVLLLKAPSRAKRRLAAELGAPAGRAAAELLLACALEDMDAWDGPTVFAPAGQSDADWLAHAGIRNGDVVMQHGTTLGMRIASVDTALRSNGCERLLYIGTDCPALDGGYLRQAESALERTDAVLGPAADGGVVLMGSRTSWPPIDDLAWSTADLFSGLRTRLAAHRRTIAILDTLADVDSAADLERARADLAADTRPARVNLSTWLRNPEAHQCPTP